MSNGESLSTVRAMLDGFAERVTTRTAWPQWHIEEVPASPVHGASAMLIFASLTDRTVEEIVVTVELHEKEGLWSIDVIDREALPLVEPAEMQSGGNEHLQSVGLLAEAVARLEGRIVETLKDLRHEF